MRVTWAGTAILTATAFLLTLASASAAAPSRMAGFATLAAGSERVDIIGIPAWRSGDFRIGEDGTRGHVRRRAEGSIEARGPDEDHRTEHVTRRGRLSFVVAGPAVGGTLSGVCRYDRGEARLHDGPVDTSVPTLPLRYACTFARDGRPAGDLLLEAQPALPRPMMVAARAGRIVLDGVALDLRSVHALEGVRWPVERPVGYLMAMQDRPVAAVDLNGGRRAPLALPHDPAQRRTALVAALAIALFWDPGDTDD